MKAILQTLAAIEKDKNRRVEGLHSSHTSFLHLSVCCCLYATCSVLFTENILLYNCIDHSALMFNVCKKMIDRNCMAVKIWSCVYVKPFICDETQQHHVWYEKYMRCFILPMNVHNLKPNRSFQMSLVTFQMHHMLTLYWDLLSHFNTQSNNKPFSKTGSPWWNSCSLYCHHTFNLPNVDPVIHLYHIIPVFANRCTCYVLFLKICLPLICSDHTVPSYKLTDSVL